MYQIVRWELSVGRDGGDGGRHSLDIRSAIVGNRGGDMMRWFRWDREGLVDGCYLVERVDEEVQGEDVDEG